MPKILIVDDSPTERHVLTQILEAAGFQAVAAEDGESGLDMARAELPDLVLMDVVMPGLNGFQATRKLKRDPATGHIPVIIVTTKDQDTDREWGMRQGAVDYMVKPIQGSQLVEMINRTLAS